MSSSPQYEEQHNASADGDNAPAVTSNGQVTGQPPTQSANQPSVQPAPQLPEPSVSAVSVKVPPLYRNNPEAWFRTLESQFHLARITSEETKYHYLVAHLPEDISSMLITAATPRLYEPLKAAIAGMLQKSQQEKINEILATSDLGGDKPSIFVKKLNAKMSECGMASCPDMLKATLIRCLPSELRIALSGFQKETPEKLAEIADFMISYHNTAGSVSAVQPQMSPMYQARLKEEPQHRQLQPPSSLAPFKPGQRPVVCRAHVYYGVRARTCRPWCRFPSAPGVRRPRILGNHETTPAQSRAGSPTRQSSN